MCASHKSITQPMTMSLFLLRLGVLVLALTQSSACTIPPQHTNWSEKSDALLAAQEKTAEQVNAAPGMRKVIYAGFALHAGSTAFQGDVTLVRDILRSINSQTSVLVLSNQREHGDLVYPLGTKENVKKVISNIARSADKNTLVVLLFTSHGSPNRIDIKLPMENTPLANLSDEELRNYLEDLGSIPTIIVLSACYSGSFLPALANQNRILITAASEDRASFGCSSQSKATYFIEEFFQHNFDASMSLAELFSQASRQVAEREKEKKFPASQPQIFVGKEMKRPAAVPLKDLLTKIEQKP